MRAITGVGLWGLWLVAACAPEGGSVGARGARGQERVAGGPDADGDGLSDGDELLFGTDPANVDSDGDGAPDGAEVLVLGTDPRVDEADCLPWIRDFAFSDGDYPAQQRSFDVDRDGDQDLVRLERHLTWMPNQGGALGEPTELVPLGDDVHGGELVDVDGDGLADALYTSDDSGMVAWARNEGPGRFAQPAVLYAGQPGTRGAALLDVDADGLRDLVVGTNSGWSWHRNLGGLSFGAPIALGWTAGRPGLRTFAADVDGDGREDLISALWDGILVVQSLAPGFGAPVTLSTHSQGAQDLEVVDVDGDGDLDFLVALLDLGLQLHRNAGGFQFDPPLVISARESKGTAISDIDGDGDLDVIGAGEDEVWVSESSGSGWRDVVVATPTQDRDDFFGASAIDLDGDHDLDVISALQTSGYFDYAEFQARAGDDRDRDGLTLSIERCIASTDPATPDSDGGGTSDLEEVWALTDPSAGGDDLPLVDGDADGLSDRVEAHVTRTDPVARDTDGDGLSDGEEILLHGTRPRVADLDGDGLSDGDEVLGQGTDPWQPDTDLDLLTDGDEVLVHGTDPLAVDTDGDGLPDQVEIDLGTDPLRQEVDLDRDGLPLVAELDLGTDPSNADTDGDGLDDGSERTWELDPLDPDTDHDGMVDGYELLVLATDPRVDDGSCQDWTEHEIVFLGWEAPRLPWTLIDVEPDGDLDLVTGEESGRLVSLENVGSGVFVDKAKRLDTWVPDEVHAADFNGDGLTDLATLTRSVPSGLSVAYGLGGGQFTPMGLVSNQSPDRPMRMVAMDLDNDGFFDLAVRFRNDVIAVYRGGSAGFGPMQWVDVSCASGRRQGTEPVIECVRDRQRGPDEVSLSSGDLDGDGLPDLIVADETYNEVLWYRSLGATLAPAVLVADVRNPVSAIPVDLDGDGDLDLVVSGKGLLRTTWWENLGAGRFGAERLVVAGCAENLAAADVDTDGDEDVLVMCHDMTWWAENLGQGTFSPVVLEETNLFDIRPADMDHDGDLDLVTYGEWAELSLVWLDNDWFEDRDADGLDEEIEICLTTTDVAAPDTDGDGVNDGDEVLAGSDPRVP